MEELEKYLASYSGNVIKDLRKSKGFTQKELGEKIGVSGSAVANYEKGYRSPLQDTLFRLAETFNVSVNHFFPKGSINHEITSIYNQLEPPRQEYVYSVAEEQLEEQSSELEYYGYTAAGSPIENQQPPMILGNGTDVSLLVSGDSMEQLYSDGDVITYRKQPSLENGEIGVFVLNGGITMKQFKLEGGNIKLRSLNDRYEDIIVNEADEFLVLGKVIK